MFRAAMLFALSTSHKIGLAGTGAAFIVFSLICAMVVPRFAPNFPGRARNVFLLICLAFFAAMISAVMIFGKEKKKAEAAAAPAASSTPAPPATKGDPAAGKAVFASAGCAACHTFKAAGAAGKVRPDLDKLPESATTAKQPLEAFIEQSIIDPNAYVAAGYSKGIMPPNFGTTLTKEQIADVVAFLSQGK